MQMQDFEAEYLQSVTKGIWVIILLFTATVFATLLDLALFKSAVWIYFHGGDGSDIEGRVLFVLYGFLIFTVISSWIFRAKGEMYAAEIGTLRQHITYWRCLCEELKAREDSSQEATTSPVMPQSQTVFDFSLVCQNEDEQKLVQGALNLFKAENLHPAIVSRCELALSEIQACGHDLMVSTQTLGQQESKQFGSSVKVMHYQHQLFLDALAELSSCKDLLRGLTVPKDKLLPAFS